MQAKGAAALPHSFNITWDIAGFTSLGDIADPVQKADAVGFAWFWTFLGVIAVAFGTLGIWIIRTHRENEDA
jgi:hypothetical protein